MKAAELEALVIAQGKKLQEQAEAHMHLVQRADNIVEGFKQELAARDERIQTLTAQIDETFISLKKAMSEFRDYQDGMNDTLHGATTQIEELNTLVRARNSSAPTKRNMTDDDAMRVMVGDLKEMAHKDAAEKIGLTYAQVYSCRCEFTFKHVHKDLRDSLEGWKNPWAK